MYEKNGRYGLVNLVINKSEFTLNNTLYQFTMAGWHKCNDLYHVMRCREDHTLEDSYVLISTVAGKGILKTPQGEFSLVKDSIALIDCSQYGEYYTALGQNWEFHFIHFRQQNMAQIYEYLKQRGKLVQNFSNASRINHGIETIITIKNSYQDGIEFKVSRLLSDMIHEILDQSMDSYRPDPLISDVIRYMREHFGEKLELQTLSDQFYVSKNYLCCLFKKYLNQSPYAHLTKIRIEESKKLLVSTNYSLKQIATMCGFSTPNNFITTFKKFESITPNKFRKQAVLSYQSL